MKWFQIKIFAKEILVKYVQVDTEILRLRFKNTYLQQDVRTGIINLTKQGF